MALESATYISQLVSSNPVGTDDASQGDNHIRLVKETLQSSFPNASKPVYFPSVIAAKTANYTVVAPTDGGKVIPVSAASGAITITLPASVSIDAFSVTVVKTDYSLNAVTVSGNGKTINGRSSKVLSKAYQKIRLFYSTELSAWLADEDQIDPVGSFKYGGSATAPEGYVLADGTTTIGNASSGGTIAAAYVESLFLHLWNSYNNTACPVSSGRGASAAADFAANKTITMPDLRGRALFGHDTMGASAASRLTTAGSGVDGATAGASGGAENVTIGQEHLPDIEVDGWTSEDGAHTHTYTRPNTTVSRDGSDSQCLRDTTTGTTSSDGEHWHDVTVELNPDGQSDLGIMPPAFVAYTYLAM